MIITRQWAMPNKNTFSIKPIKQLIEKYITEGKWLDSCCNESIFKHRTLNNDLNPNIQADYHLDSLDFFKMFQDNSIDGVLYDPVYSNRQLSECYKSIGLETNKELMQSSFHSIRKNEIARIIKPNGLCLSFGWNTNGIGIKRNFKIIEILLVAHGGSHNDTICVVETKNDK